MGALYLGNLEGAKDVKVLRAKRIRAVLTLIVRSDLRYEARDVPEHKVVEIDDNPGFRIGKYLDEIVQWIELQRSQKYNVLVHCYAGISRSASAVIAYLMHKNGWSYEKALLHCRARREVTNPNTGFAQQLREYEKRVAQIRQHERASVLPRPLNLLEVRAPQVRDRSGLRSLNSLA